MRPDTTFNHENSEGKTSFVVVNLQWEVCLDEYIRACLTALRRF